MNTFNNVKYPLQLHILITNVPDFKGYIERYILDGQDGLVGIQSPFMQDKIPIIQYKIHPKSID